ncbi:hypothetical protein [Acidovorax lacteus]|uniref:hypothetical protein n=1 Tax=Acidovorax lacteus TaxID=1924988 RepID=UPI0031EFE91E
MLLLRWVVMALLLAAAVSFMFYIGTGQPRYRRFGTVVLKWTLIATCFFFAVVFISRLGV